MDGLGVLREEWKRSICLERELYKGKEDREEIKTTREFEETRLQRQVTVQTAFLPTGFSSQCDMASSPPLL